MGRRTPISAEGPPGPKGARGATGPRGRIGRRGPPGPKGLTGPLHKGHLLNMIVTMFDDLSRQVDEQMKRMVRMQLQIDAIVTTLRKES